MNKQVELILKKIEYLLNEANYETYTDVVLGKIEVLKKLKSFTNSLQEYPVGKVWHDASEEPDEDRQVLIISDVKFGWLCYYHRDNQTFYLDCKPFRLLCEVKKWAYLDDLIDIQEEPVNGIVKEARVLPAMLSNFGNSVYNFEVELTQKEKGVLDMLSFNKPTRKIMLL